MADLFDHAGERIALETGKSKSQVLTELVHGEAKPIEHGLFAITVEGNRFDVTFDPTKRIA